MSSFRLGQEVGNKFGPMHIHSPRTAASVRERNWTKWPRLELSRPTHESNGL